MILSTTEVAVRIWIFKNVCVCVYTLERICVQVECRFQNGDPLSYVDFFDIYSDNFKNMVLGTLRYSPTDRPTAQEIFERVTKLHQTSTSESMADRQVFLCGVCVRCVWVCVCVCARARAGMCQSLSMDR